MNLIDCHVHIGAWPQWDLSLSIDDFDRVMEAYRFTGAVVMPPLIDKSDPVGCNSNLQRQVEKREDLFFFAWVHMERDGSNEASMLEYLKKNRSVIRGIKLH